MFILRGKPVYENLATSYVLVDALVADLCEGGFTGVVEVVLRDVDGHIIINQGRVVSAIEEHVAGNGSDADSRLCQRTQVAQLAARSRRERGRVSVYSFSTTAATALAERTIARPLYTSLSTEFADLEKMISKLARERDRQWFVELQTDRGVRALIQLRDDLGLVIMAGEGQLGAEARWMDLETHPVLRRLVLEARRAGGRFDVYFKPEDEEVEYETYSLAGPPDAESYEPPAEIDAEFENPVEEAVAETETPVALDADHHGVEKPIEVSDEPEGDGLASQPIERIEASPESTAGEESVEEEPPAEEPAPILDENPVPPPEKETEPEAHASLNWTGSLTEAARVMSEILRRIERVAAAFGVGPGFGTQLRVGQARVADRYSFLDPFAGEFEYDSGEIRLDAGVSADEFLEGTIQAVWFTVQDLAETSGLPDHFRARVEGELRTLLTSLPDDLQHPAVEKVVELIVR